MEIPELFYVETPRDLLALTGRDRASFLQGMVTNDVLDLEPGQGCYAFHLDATGHVLADMRVLVQEDRILLDLEPGVGPVLAELLDHYLVMERVKIAPLAGLQAMTVGGKDAEDTLLAFYVSLGDAESSNVTLDIYGEPVMLVRSSFLTIPTFVHFAGEQATRWVESPEDEKPTEWFEGLRIFSGIPKFGADIDKRVLAPETGQAARAIHYKKGCYVGQEIVARIDARGHTNRALAGFWLNETVPAETPVTVEGKEVGRVTSSAAWENGVAVALGYLRNEFAAPGTAILAGGVSGTVRELS